MEFPILKMGQSNISSHEQDSSMQNSDIKKGGNLFSRLDCPRYFQHHSKKILLLGTHPSRSQLQLNKYLCILSNGRMIEDTAEEKFFRESYAQELQRIKHERELEEERKKVKQQAMKTPGRRGEQIKHEEIDKEIVRRYRLKGK